MRPLQELSAVHATPDAWRRACIGAAAAVFVWMCALDSLAQSCPAADPNQNYNCPVGPVYTLPGWGNVPWSLPAYYPNILFGDLDGDGRDELIGRDPLGVHVWSYNVALGTWQPWIASDGTGELVLPLSDYYSWNLPPYNQLSLINLPGRVGKVLVGRYNYGLVLWALNKASDKSVDLPAGAWTQLASSGPFGDLDCFSNGKCWYDAPYYQNIQFGNIDGEPGDEVLGWGGDGIVAYKWNGSAWTSITGFPHAGDGGVGGPGVILGNVDGVAAELMQFEGDGHTIQVQKYLPGSNGGSWTNLPPLLGLIGPSPIICEDTPSCWSTLQASAFGPDGPVLFLRNLGCSANGGGLAGARYNAATQSWKILFTGGPFDDCSGFSKQQYYETIQFARLTGNALPELIGRGPGGIEVYQWNGTAWTPLSTNVPALSDPLWASDASYWRTITSARIDGSGRAALLARGQTGVRTWLWQNGALARPLPYGSASFPAFSGNEAVAYNLLNQFLGFGQGTIRDTYTDPAVDNTSSALRGYRNTIVSANGGCVEVAGNPPQYRTCVPLLGATNPAYTAMVNQVTKELWWAASTIDYFTSIQTMQNELFTVEGTELPSIDSNLMLARAEGVSAAPEWLQLFVKIFQLIGAATGQPEISAAANAVSVVQSATALFETKPPSLPLTYAQIVGQIASQQQEAQTKILFQKHHVLSDYNLLSTVGLLTASQVWTVDEAGFLSYNRQAFTTWVYQTFLPLLWSRYEVTHCGDDEHYVCEWPSNGPNMQSYVTYTEPEGQFLDFVGLLQIATRDICEDNGNPHGQQTCNFYYLNPSPLTTALLKPISPQCTYNAAAGTAWVYANPNANPPVEGCSIGPAPAIFENQLGWKFSVVKVGLRDTGVVIDPGSTATRIGGPPRLRLAGETRGFDDNLDLRTATLTVHRLLEEAYWGGELLDDVHGDDFAQVTLTPSSVDQQGGKARFESAAGASPHITVDVATIPAARELEFVIQAESASIAAPLLCLGTPPTTKLHFSLEIAGGGLSTPRVLSQVQDWACVKDRAGRIRTLRSTGNGVYGP